MTKRILSDIKYAAEEAGFLVNQPRWSYSGPYMALLQPCNVSIKSL